MIVTKLMGGFGNQMFQYAAARSLALEKNEKLYVDLNFLLDRTPHPNVVFRDFDLPVLNIQHEVASEALLEQFFGSKNKLKNLLIKGSNKILNKKYHYYLEPFFHFNPLFFELPGNSYLEGYFQSEKYFSKHAAVIRKDFSLKKTMTTEVEQMLQKIASDQQAVCLNVRRGDFVSNPAMNAEHGVLGLDYYYSAAREMAQRFNGITLYVFSDDVAWCSSNMNFDVPAVFVDHRYAGEKFSTYLWLMKQCKHFIIPNSTFGWWSAWLGEYPGKTVIAPKRWFNTSSKNTKDILPEAWIKL